MASIEQGFNASTVEPPKSFDPIPNGEYTLMITNSDLKPTQSGGKYYEFEIQVVEGPHRGRKLWERLNIVHKKQQVVEIARSQLGALCKAVRILQPKDTVELHNIPFVGTVVCKKRKDNGEFTNELTYKAENGQLVSPRPRMAGNFQPPPQPQQQQPPQQTYVQQYAQQAPQQQLQQQPVQQMQQQPVPGQQQAYAQQPVQQMQQQPVQQMQPAPQMQPMATADASRPAPWEPQQLQH